MDLEQQACEGVSGRTVGLINWAFQEWEHVVDLRCMCLVERKVKLVGLRATTAGKRSVMPG